ncbi:hypothetical protein DRE_00035 [Drechslerella stenobrocha 248]|uniref:NADP-dependent oxidoreductase domain-containing protein n=1 Tax=Drechslerella stenobrocha 248 TaxID=1043628 RepID=W7IHJ7_9PEZI|nr:hypothetical protein DRE_00035 [Drechslerella stenobrocha 248]
MTIGENSRITDLEEAKQLIETFKSYGHKELDTARIYNEGTTEEYLGKIGTGGLIVATKLYPSAKPGQDNTNANNNIDILTTQITHRPESFKIHVPRSLSALKLSSVDLWYLHAPDHTTDFSITLPAVNDLYTAGVFKTFGLSNYKSWEVARICELARYNNFPMPKVYQGMYNVIQREVEPELFPCLRHYGMAFYAYNPLAGGFFTASGPKAIDAEVEKGTRFDNSKPQGQMYRARYWRGPNFKARELIDEVAQKHNLTLVEIALRWVNHHSAMSPEKGDKVIIGASSQKHLKENCEDFEKGPLPEEILQVCDAAWAIVKADCETYWR